MMPLKKNSFKNARDHYWGQFKKDVWMGPIASKQQLDQCLSYIETGKRRCHPPFGGEPLTDGDYQNGYFIEPAIFEHVTSDMTIAQEEIFGPVIALIKVQDINEAFHIANDVVLA